MDMTMAVPVSFTAGALAEIHRLVNAPGFDTTKFLRIGVKEGVDVRAFHMCWVSTTKTPMMRFLNSKDKPLS